MGRHPNIIRNGESARRVTLSIKEKNIEFWQEFATFCIDTNLYMSDAVPLFVQSNVVFREWRRENADLLEMRRKDSSTAYDEQFGNAIPRQAADSGRH